MLFFPQYFSIFLPSFKSNTFSQRFKFFSAWKVMTQLITLHFCRFESAFQSFHILPLDSSTIFCCLQRLQSRDSYLIKNLLIVILQVRFCQLVLSTKFLHTRPKRRQQFVLFESKVLLTLINSRECLNKLIEENSRFCCFELDQKTLRKTQNQVQLKAQDEIEIETNSECIATIQLKTCDEFFFFHIW